jgi:NADPH:quinone reductase
MNYLIQVGDRVFWVRCIGGSYKELTLTDEYLTFPLHSQLSFQQGAAIGVPYFTAYRALVTKARIVAGEKVLIHGASGAVSTDCPCTTTLDPSFTNCWAFMSML